MRYGWAPTTTLHVGVLSPTTLRPWKPRKPRRRASALRRRALASPSLRAVAVSPDLLLLQLLRRVQVSAHIEAPLLKEQIHIPCFVCLMTTLE
jgi:hypothetical protein